MRNALLLLLLPFFSFGNSDSEIPAIYKNRKLRVAVYDSPPFGMLENDKYAGLMVNLWKDIAAELGCQSDFTLTNMDDLLNGLQEGHYDIGLGAISITPNRETRVDFTQAVNPSGTGIATAADSSQNAFKNYWQPIIISLLKLIGSLLFVLLLSGTIVWLVERQFDLNKKTDRSIKDLSDGLWWSAVTMTTVGYGDKVPNSQAGKVLGIIWIFTSIILLSLFTANASAILTANKLKSHIQSEEQLRRVNVGAVTGSSGAEYLLRAEIQFDSFPDIETAIEGLLDSKIDCIVSNVPVLKYHNNRKAYAGKLAISSKLLLKNNMGIALADDSPLREAIDQILLTKIAEPKWQGELYKYLGEE